MNYDFDWVKSEVARLERRVNDVEAKGLADVRSMVESLDRWGGAILGEVRSLREYVVEALHKGVHREASEPLAETTGRFAHPSRANGGKPKARKRRPQKRKA